MKRLVFLLLYCCDKLLLLLYNHRLYMDYYRLHLLLC